MTETPPQTTYHISIGPMTGYIQERLVFNVKYSNSPSKHHFPLVDPRGTHSAPKHPDSFVLHNNSLKSHRIRPWHPPLRGRRPPLFWEILDPSLFTTSLPSIFFDIIKYKCKLVTVSVGPEIDLFFLVLFYFLIQ